MQARMRLKTLKYALKIYTYILFKGEIINKLNNI